MADLLSSSIEELKKRAAASMTITEKAIIAHPETYREIKQMLDHIVADTIDIGEYQKTAEQLSRLLEIMISSGTSSIFYYFYNNIDPRQGGDVRYFRATCMDLMEQIRCIDDMRRCRRNIRLVSDDRH
jgi:hypothetical protein